MEGVELGGSVTNNTRSCNKFSHVSSSVTVELETVVLGGGEEEEVEDGGVKQCGDIPWNHSSSLL